MHCIVLGYGLPFVSQLFKQGFAMFSIAVWLDSVKAKAGIESDYRLAKVIRKNQTTISNYRTGRSLPDEEIVIELCELSGEDPGLLLARINEARAKDDKARAMWHSIAQRLQGGAASVLGLVLSAIVLVALWPHDARAAAPPGLKSVAQTVYYVNQILKQFVSWTISGFKACHVSRTHTASAAINFA